MTDDKIIARIGYFVSNPVEPVVGQFGFRRGGD